MIPALRMLLNVGLATGAAAVAGALLRPHLLAAVIAAAFTLGAEAAGLLWIFEEDD
jgi:hypothetical protein